MRDPLVQNLVDVARSAPRAAGRIDPDRRIRLLATRQHGVVARWQLERLRISANVIDHRLARDRLVRLHPGVYAVGHDQLRPQGLWIAGVLCAGPGAVLTEHHAVVAHGATARTDRRIAVATIRQGVRSRPGLRVRTTRALDPADVTVIDGVPVASLARTVVDLADVSRRRDVVTVLNRVLSRRMVDDAAIDAALLRTRGRRGAGPERFRGALAEVRRYGVVLTRSEAEDLVHEICDRHGLPRPTMNHRAHGYEIDAAYPGRRIGIEIDSYEFHDNRWSFVTDRRKLRALQLAGWCMLPFAAADLLYDEERFVDDVAAALAGARPGRSAAA